MVSDELGQLSFGAGGQVDELKADLAAAPAMISGRAPAAGCRGAGVGLAMPDNGGNGDDLPRPQLNREVHLGPDFYGPGGQARMPPGEKSIENTSHWPPGVVTVTRVATGTRNRSRRSTMWTSSGGSQTT